MSLIITLSGANFPTGRTLPPPIPALANCLVFGRYGGDAANTQRNYGSGGNAQIVGPLNILDNGIETQSNDRFLRYGLSSLEEDNLGASIIAIAFTVRSDSTSGLINLWRESTTAGASRASLIGGTNEVSLSLTPPADTLPESLSVGASAVLVMRRLTSAGVNVYNIYNSSGSLVESLERASGGGQLFYDDSVLEVGNSTTTAAGGNTVHGAGVWNVTSGAATDSLSASIAEALAATIR